MRFSAHHALGRSGFKREFLEINKIHIYGFKHFVRASPRNEGF